MLSNTSRRKNGQFSASWEKKVSLALMVASIAISIPNFIHGSPKSAVINPQAGVVQVAQAKSLEDTAAPVVRQPATTGEMVEYAIMEFVPEHYSEASMVMHCLLHRESGHGASKGHGDNGLAGGPMQFHQATWTRMRNAMKAQGINTPDADRYDLYEAVRTTAWAMKESKKPANQRKGSILEWGPVLRASQGKTNATCPKPSFVRSN